MRSSDNSIVLISFGEVTKSEGTIIVAEIVMSEVSVDVIVIVIVEDVCFATSYIVMCHNSPYLVA